MRIRYNGETRSLSNLVIIDERRTRALAVAIPKCRVVALMSTDQLNDEVEEIEAFLSVARMCLPIESDDFRR